LLAACTQAPTPPPAPPPPPEPTGLERRPIPPSGIHTVAHGETLSEIAWVYRLDVEALARANGITDPDVIATGRRLALRWFTPPEVAAPPARAAPARAAETEPAAEAAPAAEPLRVVVPVRSAPSASPADDPATPPPAAGPGTTPPVAAPEE
jgi:LysM repeat protein